MSRGTDWQRQRQPARSNTLSNGQAPPSTATAQIVNSIARGEPPQSADRAFFEQLLLEILGNENGSNESSQDRDLETNLKLIQIVTNAGLDVLLDASPFESAQRLLPQARNSLAVICLSIERNPLVLFSICLESSQQADGPQITLLFWLVTRLLRLYLAEQDLHDEIFKVLLLCFKTDLSYPEGSERSLSVTRFVKASVYDLSAFIRDSLQKASCNQPLSSVQIPSLQTLSDSFSAAAEEKVDDQAPKTTIDNVEKALALMYLLMHLCIGVSTRTKLAIQSRSTPNDYIWILDNLRLLSSSIQELKARNLISDTLSSLIIMMERSQSILDIAIKNSDLGLISIKASNLLIRSVSSLLIQVGALDDEAQSKVLLVLQSLLSMSVKVPSIYETIRCYLIPVLCRTVDSAPYNALSQDLKLVIQNCVNLCLSQYTSDLTPGEKALMASVEIHASQMMMMDVDSVTTLQNASSTIEEDSPARDVSPLVIDEEAVMQRASDIQCLLTQSDGHFKIMSSLDKFFDLPETTQCDFIKGLGYLACANARTLIRDEPAGVCSFCDGDCYNLQRNTSSNSVIQEESQRFLAAIVKHARFQLLGRQRVLTIHTVRRVLNHSANASDLDLQFDKLAQWSIHQVISSMREMRIAATRLLPCFLNFDIEESTIDREGKKMLMFRNMTFTATYLGALCDKDELGLQETMVLAWSQFGRCARDDHFTGIIFKRLVECLGHPNPLVHGSSYNELLGLASLNNITPDEMLSPYLYLIAPDVVSVLQTRPQIAQSLCDLTGQTVPDFLARTQLHTVPRLVLHGKRETLKRIAQAKDENGTVFSMCFDDRELMSAIVAMLLAQPSANLEDEAFSILCRLDSQFDQLEELAELIESDAIRVAHRLLMMAGDLDNEQAKQVHKAFHIMLKLYFRRIKPSAPKQKKHNAVSQFFDVNILGVMTHFTDVINDSQRMQSNTEKLRCLRAIREMIIIAKSYIFPGLPQISACLQAALEADGSRDLALSIWLIMMKAIDEDEVELLLGSTFSIIVKQWKLLKPDSKQLAIDYLSYLFKNQSASIRLNVGSIPSLLGIPELENFDSELQLYRGELVMHQRIQMLIERCQHDNLTVVAQAFFELETLLQTHQAQIHEAALREQPDPIVTSIVRVAMDGVVKYSGQKISKTSARCLGLMGSLDPNRFEAVREKRDKLLISNFERVDETIDLLLILLEDYLIKGYLSATSTRAQGFYAFVMQEVLRFCGLSTVNANRARDNSTDENYRRWVSLPETVRSILAPFLDSRYTVTLAFRVQAVYPIFTPEVSHATWLRMFIGDLMDKAVGDNPQNLFPILLRAVQPQETAIANFLIPYVVLNIVAGGTDSQRDGIVQELMVVLKTSLDSVPHHYSKNIKLCSETVFSILDYLSRCMQERRKLGSQLENSELNALEIQRVASLLSAIPAEIIAHRALECSSYARALFYWEQYIRDQKDQLPEPDNSVALEPLYERLQNIYTQIDEPDGIEGVSAHIHILNIDQQILQHRKAGRWNAAQGWYELQLMDKPTDQDLQADLLTCLKESGQYDVLLSHVDSWFQSSHPNEVMASLAVEAAWNTGKWNAIQKLVELPHVAKSTDFNIGLGRALLALRDRNQEAFLSTVEKLREVVAGGFSYNGTASLQDCHEPTLRLHVLTELDMISGLTSTSPLEKAEVMTLLDNRLEIMGTFMSDKQHLLALRRAAMQLSTLDFSSDEIASVWLTSAKLARKTKAIGSSFNAVLRASQLGARSSTIEHSKILWQEGSHRNAIQTLQGAIAAGFFRPDDVEKSMNTSMTASGVTRDRQNMLVAKAHLLLAKWLDSAGQTHSQSIIDKFHTAAASFTRWEKGHYHLGKHYNKILDFEKAQPPNKQSQSYITGETTKLVVGNYLRSLAYGTKYIFQTLPKLLTLWLELGEEVDKPIDPKCGSGEKFRSTLMSNRRAELKQIHKQLKKYIENLPAFVFYTALPHIVARVCHPNDEVYKLLQQMIVKVVSTHPQHAMWTLLAVEKSSDPNRRGRGNECIKRVIQASQRKLKTESGPMIFGTFVLHAQRMSEGLLGVCDGEIMGKGFKASLSRHLRFNHNIAPCPLVVPAEGTLTASLPTVTDRMSSHKAFSSDINTISCFMDDVLILNSLQKPRKVTVRGTDGKWYGLLCKPKDDLRKDQRLMEFNTMINRSLKRDAECSKRRLYIKTYSVTPLNEECGLIEWVDNLKTFREILFRLYSARSVTINYAQIRADLDYISADPVREKHKFQKLVLDKFPPVFHEWFVEMFPEPSAWFTARLRYTRSCAVMSMVGMVLGLGDRHGENILLEEGNGGIFHVDFNCLFDKGLTMEKPELVPFRLTHNMVDAFGVQGIEGPFRKSCELTLGILRQNEDTLMTILETFLHDPTTDFISKRKRSRPGVPDTPQEVLDSVRGKVRGLLRGESVPLSVEGHVHELIQQSVSHSNLACMYVGWCAYL